MKVKRTHIVLFVINFAILRKQTFLYHTFNWRIGRMGGGGREGQSSRPIIFVCIAGLRRIPKTLSTTTNRRWIPVDRILHTIVVLNAHVTQLYIYMRRTIMARTFRRHELRVKLGRFRWCLINSAGRYFRRRTGTDEKERASLINIYRPGTIDGRAGRVRRVREVRRGETGDRCAWAAPESRVSRSPDLITRPSAKRPGDRYRELKGGDDGEKAGAVEYVSTPIALTSIDLVRVARPSVIK